MNKHKRRVVKDIINTALDEAKDSTYCVTCSFAYLRPNDISGYCGHDDNRKQMHPKEIDIFHSCQHWKRKC
jgi:hypothetical protein